MKSLSMITLAEGFHYYLTNLCSNFTTDLKGHKELDKHLNYSSWSYIHS